MSIVAQSVNAGEVLRNAPLLQARVDFAMARLRFEISYELLSYGADNDNAAVQKIIDGLPSDVLTRKLAART